MPFSLLNSGGHVISKSDLPDEQMVAVRPDFQHTSLS